MIGEWCRVTSRIVSVTLTRSVVSPMIRHNMMVCVCVVVIVLSALAAPGWCQGVPAENAASGLLTPERKAALGAIEAGSLKAHVSFLASDALQGRDTPSPGLEIAAEYIASRFRGAGLEPAGDDGYFQTSRWSTTAADPASFRCVVNVGDRTMALPPERVSLAGVTGPLEMVDAPILWLTDVSEEALNALTAETIEGKAVILDPPSVAGEDRRVAQRGRAGALRRLRELKAGALVTLAPSDEPGSGLPSGRLVDAERRPIFRPVERATAVIVPIAVHDRAVVEALRAAKEEPNGATLTLALGAAVEREVILKNVAGILRGSDPELAETFVIVSAHYDHIGVGAGPMTGAMGGIEGTTDRIFNGANDDASGTAMVVELAEALGRLETRPKRSILFLTFFGEEKGLFGSRYYGRRPLVPLAQTVAMINLEQVGRTDDAQDGPQVNRGSLTGFDFSDVGERMRVAGQAMGVEIFKHPKNSDAFFGRSDNQALADQGVPAHTLCVAFLYPDYHQAGDHWDKLDYANMARVGRAVGLALIALADDPAAPKWDAENPKAARYVKAAKTLSGQEAESK